MWAPALAGPKGRRGNVGSDQATRAKRDAPAFADAGDFIAEQASHDADDCWRRLQFGRGLVGVERGAQPQQGRERPQEKERHRKRRKTVRRVIDDEAMSLEETTESRDRVSAMVTDEVVFG